MTRVYALLVVACSGLATLSIARPAIAQELSRGHIGPVFAVRQDVGELAQSYDLGFLWGVRATYQPRGGIISLGAAWSVMWGRLYANAPDAAEDAAQILEMDFALRARRALGDGPRFIVASAGITLLRSNVPIPPELERIYYGPSAGLGLDWHIPLWGTQWLLQFDAKYGLIGAGPQGVSAVLGISVGAP